ncbi:MAG: winged helix-turn-helix domain-containing protein [Anaerolineae bacterium]
MALVEHLGAVQVDTLQMVHRSHYLALWSRLGSYDPALLDQAIYGLPTAENNRRLYEYWFHAACILPLSEYRYTLPRKVRRSKQPSRWSLRGLEGAKGEQVLAHVLERIRAEGGLRAMDFDGQNHGSWWGWKPAKRALELHFDAGRLMIAERRNFQRVYDLTERVLPDWVDTTVPGETETNRYLLERAVRVFGICEPLQAADYLHMKRTTARPHIEALIKAGTLLEYSVEQTGGTARTMVIHRDNLPLLEQALGGALQATRTTFLSPFDSLFWPARRDRQLWGFEQTLEAYKPAAQRRWGYFCLPILHRGALVGRFDPRLDRKTGTLAIRALYLEPGVAPTERLVNDVAAVMRDFLHFHNAQNLTIERSNPADFGAKLLAAL